jgi:hypothetical protein
LFSEPQVLTINLPRDADPSCVNRTFKHYVTATGKLPPLVAGVVTRSVLQTLYMRAVFPNRHFAILRYFLGHAILQTASDRSILTVQRAFHDYRTCVKLYSEMEEVEGPRALYFRVR